MKSLRQLRQCEKIIEAHYAAVFRFCNAVLRGDIHGAEECTQDVFLLLLKKADELDLNGPIDRWLIASASRISKKYLREKAEHTANEMEFSENIPDRTQVPADCAPEPADRASEFDVLTDDEYSLLLRYYTVDRASRGALANELGITVNALYQRIFVIKSKIKHTKGKRKPD
ncbi:MAG: sigma-70 family RNA polymerase sigma factor [Oscillospiraceae bacterium]|nr:sigma-70 family RNA polymerase sigma factor [Oscillospiraceae bacterium]